MSVAPINTGAPLLRLLPFIKAVLPLTETTVPLFILAAFCAHWGGFSTLGLTTSFLASTSLTAAAFLTLASALFLAAISLFSLATCSAAACSAAIRSASTLASAFSSFFLAAFSLAWALAKSLVFFKSVCASFSASLSSFAVSTGSTTSGVLALPATTFLAFSLACKSLVASSAIRVTSALAALTSLCKAWTSLCVIGSLDFNS